jgi:hypothetical protein
VPDGTKYYAITDPDGTVAIQFDKVSIPRGVDESGVVRALPTADPKVLGGNTNVWVTFKYMLAGGGRAAGDHKLTIKAKGDVVADPTAKIVNGGTSPDGIWTEIGLVEVSGTTSPGRICH